MERVPVLVAGGGLAGLTAASRLGDRALVLERAERPGGLLLSPTAAGFTIDLVPHVFFTRDRTALDFFRTAVGRGRFARIESDVRVHSHSTLTRFPFQCCLHGLPPDVIVECIAELADAMAIPPGEARSFADYVRRSFGGGIARHFLTPYNQKLWGVEDLADLTASWVGGKVILPELQDVLDGAIRDRRYGKLPNAVIRYPRHGGIETLARGVAARVLHLSLSTKLESVDVRGRVARTSTGREIAYDALVWTLPLAALPAVVPALPGEVRSAVLALRFRDVIAVHLGIGRERVVPWHWMYYPEPRHPFYRVSFPSNLAPSTVPAGCSSVIAEVAVPPGEPVDEPALAARCVDALVESGILRCDDEIRFQAAWRVSPAYVVYDHSREAAVRVIHDFLRGHRILPAGRFGEWRFFNMDHTVLSGMQAAAAAASLLHG